jgi:hypothetical protein
MNSFQGSAQITDEGIKKHFKNYEPIRAIFELVWNGLDANCSTVKIKTYHNGLNGLECIEVVDDGEGIDIKNIGNNFEKFNESSKKNDDNKHGSHGKGRLAFHKLCGNAIWYTKRDNYNAKITINSSAIKNYEGKYLVENKQHASLYNLNTGTCVELRQFVGNKLPSNDELLSKFSSEFGWYLALNSEKSIFIDGKKVSVPEHELHEKNFLIDENEFIIKVIRWEEKPSSEKSFNYLVDRNRIIHKELSKSNNKVTFYTSAYAFSKWFEEYNPETFGFYPDYDKSQRVIKEVLDKMVMFQKEIYKNFLRIYVDKAIDKFEQNGYFPSYKNIALEYAHWRKENTKSVLKDIYIADPQIFNGLNAKPAKILIRLLDSILVSNENDTLMDVLEGVLDLTSDNLERLASQLKRTTLENVISTIEILQKRQQAIHELKEIMNNRYLEILETPDLQKIIENNTWLFGPQYTTLGAEEDTFTKIAINLRNEINDINIISLDDIEQGAVLEGVNKQVDLFLARKIPTFDSRGSQIYKCIIIEIKRPGISLNKKHLLQIDSYCEIISKHPAFNSSKMKFELILVGRKISKDDYQIKQRMNNLKDKAEYGLITNDDNIKCYVKDWFTIFDEFELSNNYLLSTLNSRLEDLTDKSTSNLIIDLQGQFVEA